MLSLGGINKSTKQYVCADIANKKDNYYCPSCKKDLIFCKGSIKKPYFRHKTEISNDCTRYTNPSTVHIHEDAQLKLQTLLQSKSPLLIHRYCVDCKVPETYEIPTVSDTSRVELEYKFVYKENNCIADIAYVDNDEIVCIFEIYNTHRTSSNKRPEPWFELNARDVITMVNNELTCVRNEKCNNCIIRDNELVKLKLLIDKSDYWLKGCAGQYEYCVGGCGRDYGESYMTYEEIYGENNLMPRVMCGYDDWRCVNICLDCLVNKNSELEKKYSPYSKRFLSRKSLKK